MGTCRSIFSTKLKGVRLTHSSAIPPVKRRTLKQKRQASQRCPAQREYTDAAV